MPIPKDHKPMSMTLHKDLYAALKSHADEHERSVSWMIRHAIKVMLARVPGHERSREK